MKIKIKGDRGPRPTRLKPPGDRRGTVIVDPGRVSPPLPVYVVREAMLEMLDHSAQGGAFEVGGFLAGGYHRYRGHTYVDIRLAVPALKAKSEKTHLTFDNESQRQFHVEFNRDHPDKLVLGWYHTHPRYSVFLSDYDLFIQRGFFASEHHVAVVIDPYQYHRYNQVGVFVWDQGDVSQGYHLIVYEEED